MVPIELMHFDVRCNVSRIMPDGASTSHYLVSLCILKRMPLAQVIYAEDLVANTIVASKNECVYDPMRGRPGKSLAAS